MTSRQSTPLGASAIRQANLREHNLGLVLRLIIDSPVPVSRADIAVATGLTRATVSSLADRLIMASLVTELPPVMSQRAGRPAVPLVPAGGTLAAVGMEINVDYLGVRVVDLSGAILGEHVESADFRGSDPVRGNARSLSAFFLPGGPENGLVRPAHAGWRSFSTGWFVCSLNDCGGPHFATGVTVR